MPDGLFAFNQETARPDRLTERSSGHRDVISGRSKRQPYVRQKRVLPQPVGPFKLPAARGMRGFEQIDLVIDG